MSTIPNPFPFPNLHEFLTAFFFGGPDEVLGHAADSLQYMMAWLLLWLMLRFCLRWVWYGR
jgi:hypothetical protein